VGWRVQEEGARGGCRDEQVVCGWVGRGSVVSWGKIWDVSCLYVGEVKCLDGRGWPQIYFPPNLQKNRKIDP